MAVGLIWLLRVADPRSGEISAFAPPRAFQHGRPVWPDRRFATCSGFSFPRAVGNQKMLAFKARRLIGKIFPRWRARGAPGTRVLSFASLGWWRRWNRR